MDTIAAVSSPPGEGAVALVRISGPEAVAVADHVFRGRTALRDAGSRAAVLGEAWDAEGPFDTVLATVFRGPASYTGEDVVEISCHGGTTVTAHLLECCCRSGARPAGPGEFTERAFLNGKLDLTQAEAVMDLIHAQSLAAVRAARAQLDGGIGDEVRGLRDGLLATLAHVEAWIDFPDEDIDPGTAEDWLRSIGALDARLEILLGSAGRGRVLREGVKTAICGAPNAGKSSLLNRLLGFDRAIVHATAGTTRDTLEERVVLGGVAFLLVDTAGLRAAVEPVEAEGVERARRAITQADLILEVIDATRPPGETARAERTGVPAIVVLNKSDLPPHPGWTKGIRLSCADGSGFDALVAAMRGAVGAGGRGGIPSGAAINARHQHHLRDCAEACGRAREAIARREPPEIIALELRAALQAAGEVIGKADAEALLGEIFARFCIGK